MSTAPSLQLLSEVLDGIKLYFDFTLWDHLLYGPEKEQHKMLGVSNLVFSKKTSNSLPGHLCDGLTGPDGTPGHQHTCGHVPSQVYGPIHLLRLFVKLPHFLTCAQIPAGNVPLLHIHCRDLLA